MDLRMFAAFWIDIMDEIPGKRHSEAGLFWASTGYTIQTVL
jgi:hypothetical protein